MKGKILGCLLALSMVAMLFTGCGKEEPVTSEVVENAQVEEQEVKEPEVIESEITEVVQEETVTTKSKEELILEKEFYNSYADLHGYWVNEDVSYYFGSFIKDGDVVFFYTTTNEPDNWYTYEITSEEYIGDFSVDDQFSSNKLSVNVTDKDGNTKELEYNVLTDYYMSKKHIDIVEGGEVLNMSQLSDYSDFTDAYNYYHFIDLKADVSGNVTLTPVEIKDITSHALINKDGKDGIYFCSDTSNGYYSFMKDLYSYVYDGYYEEDGFRDKYTFNGMTNYPWVYELVYNPYLEVGNEVFEPIPLSDEILDGYVYRISEDKSLTYNGIEGMYLDYYGYYEGYSGLEVTMEFRAVEGDAFTTIVFSEKPAYNNEGEIINYNSIKEIENGKMSSLSDMTEGEDFSLLYEKNKVVLIYNVEGLNCKVSIELDEEVNDFDSALAQAQIYVDAFSFPNGEKTIDEHFRETFTFAGYSFTEEAIFRYIKRDKDSINGLEFIETGDLSYHLNESYKKMGDSSYRRQIYDTEFAEDFEIHIQVSSVTESLERVVAYVPSDVNKYITVSGKSLDDALALLGRMLTK